MHEHMEIILPPVDDIAGTVKKILAPFSENIKEEDEDFLGSKVGFFDFYVIGGRWSGHKMYEAIGKEKMEAFREELNRRNITVSVLRAGKASLEPASQIPAVDALWVEWFPESPIKVCPLFRHYNDQYKDSLGYPDVMRLRELPEAMTAERVIIAAPTVFGKDPFKIEAKHMVQTACWNGVNYEATAWNRTVQSAIDQWTDHIADRNPVLVAAATPQDDWLSVTVDYHS